MRRDRLYTVNRHNRRATDRRLFDLGGFTLTPEERAIDKMSPFEYLASNKTPQALGVFNPQADTMRNATSQIAG